MNLKKIKNLNLKNYDDILFIYEKNEFANEFINKHDNTNIITNLDIFITYFYEQFKIEDFEYRFIISCLFEYDYFKEALLDKIDLNIFKKIIVRRVIDTLNEASMESDLIKSLLVGTGLCLKDYDNKIDKNFAIIRIMIDKKQTKFNYCYLFDNIKYFSEIPEKKENYFRFVAMILHDFHNN